LSFRSMFLWSMKSISDTLLCWRVFWCSRKEVVFVHLCGFSYSFFEKAYLNKEVDLKV
jgi:hypothetical protein